MEDRVWGWGKGHVRGGREVMGHTQGCGMGHGIKGRGLLGCWDPHCGLQLHRRCEEKEEGCSGRLHAWARPCVLRRKEWTGGGTEYGVRGCGCVVGYDMMGPGFSVPGGCL